MESVSQISLNCGIIWRKYLTEVPWFCSCSVTEYFVTSSCGASRSPSMRLSSSAFGAQSRFVLSSRWLWPVIVGLFVVIFTLDCLTETAPVQHLYYIPIILSAWGFSWRG